MNTNQVIKEWIPPALLKLIRNLRRDHGFGFEGEFESWDAAAAVCGTAGYEEQNILQKTLASVLAVKNGQAVFERDSVLFDDIQYSWPLLGAILLAAADKKDELNIVDFGGSLGSTYFQNKKFLDALPQKIRYCVVEQTHYIDIGNEKISDDNLRFYKSISDFLSDVGEVHLLILSGVLQYLSNYFKVLDDLLSKEIKLVCVDRTPFVRGGGERIMIQNVPETVYAARYAHRFFIENKFLQIFESHGYEILESFESIDKGNEFADWKGFIFMKKSK